MSAKADRPLPKKPASRGPGEAGRGAGPSVTLQAFTGSDPLAKQAALEAALAEWLGASAGDALSREVFFGEELQVERVAESYQTVPLFTARRAIILRNIDKANQAQQKILAALFAEANPQCGVFAVADKLEASSTLGKLFRARGQCRDFKTPYPNQVPGWLVNRARTGYARGLSNADARLLQEVAGNDLSDLDRELLKLDVYLPAGAPVTADAIVEVVGAQRVADIFELQANMGLRDKTRFLYSLRSLLDRGEQPFQIAMRLFNHYLLLMRIRNLSDKGLSERAICEALKLNLFFHMQKLRFLDQARARSVSMWKKLLIRLGRLERELKEGRYPHRFEIEMAFAGLV